MLIQSLQPHNVSFSHRNPILIIGGAGGWFLIWKRTSRRFRARWRCTFRQWLRRYLAQMQPASQHVRMDPNTCEHVQTRHVQKHPKTFEKIWKSSKRLEIFRKSQTFWKTSERFRALPNTFRTHPDVSERIWIGPNTFPNFPNFWKPSKYASISRKFWKQIAIAAFVLSLLSRAKVNPRLPKRTTASKPCAKSDFFHELSRKFQRFQENADRGCSLTMGSLRLS